jgi:2-polyprenyl-6-hydroxyphenyl methylase/3-demethylubiquinone-9 3-methyltransferase
MLWPGCGLDKRAARGAARSAGATGRVMPLGPTIRRLFGPLEGPVTDLYRSLFVDLDAQVAQVRRWAPVAGEILEIGCGEGAVCQRLATAFADARVTGIDVTPRVGRLFRGDRSRVRFERTTAGAFASERPSSFDLVLACDVLHHVPWSEHEALLRDAARLLAPGGALIVKEWEPVPNLGHYLSEFSDRVLTGDDVKYGSVGYFRGLTESVLGPGSVQDEVRVRPWRNNFMILAVPAR